jgi:hypothetical protein
MCRLRACLNVCLRGLKVHLIFQKFVKKKNPFGKKKLKALLRFKKPKNGQNALLTKNKNKAFAKKYFLT